jgi:formate hydrogenlyase subunit 3/multisubunit Na+/H+ antiporter MnhD subunit
MILAFSFMLLGYGIGAAAAVLAPGGRTSRWLVALGAVVGGVGGMTLAVEVFATGVPFVLEAPTLLSVADGLSFRLDALGAFFLGLVGLVAVPCGLYGVGYSSGRC